MAKEQDNTNDNGRGWHITFEAWGVTMEAQIRWMRMYKADDYAAIFTEAPDLVKEWPFEDDPRDPQAYLKLTMEEAIDLQFAIERARQMVFVPSQKDLQKKFQKLDKTIRVD